MAGRKNTSRNSKSSVPRTSLAPEFDVQGPWDETEPLLYIRCDKCGCTNRYEEGDDEATEILSRGFGLRRIIGRRCSCNCHSGIEPRPLLKVKREVA